MVTAMTNDKCTCVRGIFDVIKGAGLLEVGDSETFHMMDNALPPTGLRFEDFKRDLCDRLPTKSFEVSGAVGDDNRNINIVRLS